MIHVNIRVYGKVQGVFYRASAKDKAEALMLKGFVRNEPNGDVYLEVEGDDVKIQQLIEWCHAGPPRAEVVHVEVTTGVLVNFDKFDIKR